ncbi:hypothetical protein [Jiella sp. M17.18]|uniref:hypothetical protein n=1 Tax=Jiella sp. M17.18 TaxID=3234247 RepID=UPI0034DE33B6
MTPPLEHDQWLTAPIGVATPRRCTLASILRSVVSRVGSVVPDVIAEALRTDPALNVLREYPLPITRSATELVKANRKDIDAILPHDLHVVGSWTADLVVIDETTRHASIHEVKRGGCVVSGTRCAETIERLRIVAHTARRALNADGFDVASVSASVIDRYGRTGHEPTMTVGPGELDDVFGIPCRAPLDRLDETVRSRLLERIAPTVHYLAEALAPHSGVSGGVDDGRNSSASNDIAAEDDQHPGARDRAKLSINAIDLSRFIGIAERRRQTDHRRMN